MSEQRTANAFLECGMLAVIAQFTLLYRFHLLADSSSLNWSATLIGREKATCAEPIVSLLASTKTFY